MSEEQKDQKGRLDGIAVGGTVLGKKSWPSKEGKEPSWSVELAYLGGRSFVNVSEAVYNRVSPGTYQMFLVSQRANGDKIYCTAIERS